MYPITAGGTKAFSGQSRFGRLRRSFLWRLSLAFFGTSFLLFFAFCYFFQVYWRNYTNTTSQLTNWGVAEEHLRQFGPLLSPEVDQEAVDKAIYQASLSMPQQEIYILNAEGVVMFPTRKTLVWPFSKSKINPIERFLRQREILTTPLYTTSPSDPHQDEEYVFSAARVQLGSEPGYLLVLLTSLKFGAAENMLGDLTAFSAVMLFAAIGFGLSVALGVSMFYLLTRRFSQMTAILRDFRGGDYTRRLADTAQDELGEHAETINQMADQIVASMQAVKDRDASRRELIAGVAHDLRTPVAVMMIGLETLLQEVPQSPPEAVTSRVRQLVRSCESLDSLVQELFELSKLGAEHFKPNFAPVAVHDLLSGMQEQFSAAAQAQGIELAVTDCSPEWIVLVDPLLIERVIGNLTKNALAYTPTGGCITLAASLSTRGIILAVRDTGVGIPESALPHVFDRFYRAENQTTPEAAAQGTGLGLAIVKRIVELHNSTISLRSTLGVETEFSFELPLVETSEKPRALAV